MLIESFSKVHSQLQLCDVTTMIDWPASSAAGPPPTRRASRAVDLVRRDRCRLTISAATLPKLR